MLKVCGVCLCAGFCYFKFITFFCRLQWCICLLNVWWAPMEYIIYIKSDIIWYVRTELVINDMVIIAYSMRNQWIPLAMLNLLLESVSHHSSMYQLFINFLWLISYITIKKLFFKKSFFFLVRIHLLNVTFERVCVEPLSS